MVKKPPKRSLIIRSVVIIAGILLSTFALAIMIPQGQQQQAIELQRQEAQVGATQGNLYNPYEVDLTKDFIIHLGGSHAISNSQDLANGFDLISYLISFDGKRVPVQIKFVENRISVSANVTSIDGELVAWIYENNWKSSDSLSIGERNYNAYAFEVIDRYNVPLLQVKMVGSNEIYIGGLIYIDENYSLLADKTGFTINPSQEQIEQFKDQRMFLYPSNDHFGELVEPISFPTTDNSIPLSAWLIYGGYALAVIGLIVAGLVGIDSIWEFIYKGQSHRKKA